MRPNRLQNALTALGDAIDEVNAAIEEMRREPHESREQEVGASSREKNSCALFSSIAIWLSL
jgi:hypothetical protein